MLTSQRIWETKIEKKIVGNPTILIESRPSVSGQVRSQRPVSFPPLRYWNKAGFFLNYL